MKKIGKLFKKLFYRIALFFELIAQHQITVYAAQAAYFIIVAIVPIAILTIGVARYIIDIDWLLNVIDSRLEGPVGDFLINIVKEVVENTGISLVSINVLATLWSASRGVFAVTRGICGAYGVVIRENFLLDILRSFIHTLAFIVIIVLTLIAMVFADTIAHAASSHLPLVALIIRIIEKGAPLILTVLLTLFFSVLYNTVSRKGRSFSRAEYKGLSGKLPRGFLAQIPGAAFSALGWVLFSYFFSLYMKYFPDASYLYGSLTTIMLFMLWIYFCMFILMLGAEMNMAVFMRWDIGGRRKRYLQQKKRRKETLLRVRVNCASFGKTKSKK
ncbi:MAG: YihY/virulence factor BrkB family protein [Clostridia bacterium]|nr:YihY/virulence factor BrkB family protein [Clostridia bacterium]